MTTFGASAGIPFAGSKPAGYLLCGYKTSLPSPRHTMSKLTKRILIGCLVLVAIAALAYPKIDFGSEGDAQAALTANREEPLPVNAYVVKETQLFDRVLATGTLRANEQVDLAAETSGMITRILFSEGRRVSKGDLLVKINDAELVAQRERTDFRLKLAEQQVERQSALFEKGGVSQEELDQTVNQLNVLRAELNLNEAQVAKTEVRAPFDGVIGLRRVSEGSYLSPQTTIATLQDITPIKVDFSLPEKYAGLVRTGSTIRFRVGGDDRLHSGEVYAIEPRIEQNTRTLQIRATSPNRDGSLYPGAFADVELVLNEYANALAVPAIALVSELRGRKVFVVKDGVVEARMVETGIRTDTTVQILSGLALEDTVLTSGLQLVRPGIPVKLADVR